MIDANLYAFIAAQSAITNITTTGRIWRDQLPAKPIYPAITFRGDHIFDNIFEGNTGFVKSDYTVDAWDTTQAAVILLSNAVRTSLKNVTGSFGGIMIHQCFITLTAEMVYEDSVEAYRQSQIFSIWHKEG